jgi:hypothetical protein
VTTPLEHLELNEIQIGEFKPGLWFFPELGVLEQLNEDCSYVSCMVDPGMDILRHSYEPRYAGMQYWLGYSPHRLLPKPQEAPS